MYLNMVAYSYPVSYTFQVLGFSVIRWVTFSDPSLGKLQSPEMSSFATGSFFFRFIFRLGGFINVVLILVTRPNVLLFGSRGVLSHTDPRRQREEECNAQAKSEPSGSPTEQVYQLPYISSSRARPPSARLTDINVEHGRG